jgi:ABC-type glucose/galactose transport system permease subunit
MDQSPPEQHIRRPIEAPLEEAMDRIMAQAGVKGVIVSDKEGLCVGSKGSLAPINAARLTNIFDSAMKMAPDHEVVLDGQVYFVPEQPIIIIESQNGQLVVNNIDGFCTTVAIGNK